MLKAEWKDSLRRAREEWELEKEGLRREMRLADEAHPAVRGTLLNDSFHVHRVAPGGVHRGIRGAASS